jgi:hypothetical protein
MHSGQPDFRLDGTGSVVPSGVLVKRIEDMMAWPVQYDDL